MPSKCLVVIEVSQKQRYIFSSNRLRENIGASIVVAKMTEEIPRLALQEYANSENKELGSFTFYDPNNEEPFNNTVFCFNGGGKSVYKFNNKEEAKTFIKIASRYNIKNYFGIEIFYALYEYDTDNETEIEAVEHLYEKLEEKKQTRLQSFRLIGIGLNQKCPSTSLPIHVLNKTDGIPQRLIDTAKEDLERINHDIRANSPNLDTYGKDGFNLQVYTKLAEVKEQDKFFERYLPSQYREECRFAHDMDLLGGSKNKKNQIAIITIDGNGMGERIHNLKNVLVDKNKTNSYLDVLKENSQYITDVYESAIREVTGMLCEKENWNELKQTLSLEENIKDGTRYLPIRPLIAAGDDICLLTDARIALSVTTNLLKAINDKSKRSAIIKAMNAGAKKYSKEFLEFIPENGLFASAGFVICKQKYPFSRAYELAEGLCSNAKKRLSAEKELKKNGASMLDFHIAMGEVDNTISSERARRKLNENINTRKPFVLEPKKASYAFDYHNFQKAMNMLKAVDSLNTDSESSAEKRVGKSKIKEFAYYIRQGNEMAKSFLNQTAEMSQVIKVDELENQNGNYSIFLDAIEMYDFDVDINEGRKKHENGKLSN